MDLRLRGVGGQALSFIRATWCTSGNVGDRLAPWLLEKLTGQQALYVDQRDPIPKILGCGSILAWSSATTIVWGSGLLTRDDPVHPLAEIRAVRGPLSRERALACGCECPEVYGDPGLLAPRAFPLEREPTYLVGVVPHYVDQYLLDFWHLPDGWRFISVFAGVEEFIRQLCSCRVVLSSALHGLVLADAYGIPNARLVMGDRIGGDGTKFLDYFASVKRDAGLAIPWRHIERGMQAADIEARCQVGELDVAPLLAALRGSL